MSRQKLKYRTVVRLVSPLLVVYFSACAQIGGGTIGTGYSLGGGTSGTGLPYASGPQSTDSGVSYFTLAVTIVDASNTPVSAAQVKVLTARNEERITTDKDGNLESNVVVEKGQSISFSIKKGGSVWNHEVLATSAGINTGRLKLRLLKRGKVQTDLVEFN